MSMRDKEKGNKHAFFMVRVEVSAFGNRSHFCQDLPTALGDGGVSPASLPLWKGLHMVLYC